MSKWYHFDENGVTLLGAQLSNGQNFTLMKMEVEVKVALLRIRVACSTKKVLELVTNEFFTTDGNVWCYAGAMVRLECSKVINGQHLCFNADPEAKLGWYY